MPDLISHMASAYIFRNLFAKLEIIRKPFFYMFVFGVFLPDFISRGALVVFPDFFFIVQYFHTPFACFFQTLIVSSFFVKEQRCRIFLAITLGWILHDVFDAAQILIGGGYYYFFWPVYSQSVTMNLFWPHDWPYVAISALTLAWLTTGSFFTRVLKWSRFSRTR